MALSDDIFPISLYTKNSKALRTDNAIASLPAATAEIEAAFPDRFLRDGDGDLVGIDNRPVNFARETRNQLRWGFNLSVPLRASAAQQRRLGEMFRSAFANRRFPGGPGGQVTFLVAKKNAVSSARMGSNASAAPATAVRESRGVERDRDSPPSIAP